MITASEGIESTLKRYNIPYTKESSDSKYYRFLFNIKDSDGYVLIYERDFYSYVLGVLDKEAVRSKLQVEIYGLLYSFERMIQRKLGIPQEEMFK